jgi:hypothetical protein
MCIECKKIHRPVEFFPGGPPLWQVEAEFLRLVSESLSVNLGNGLSMERHKKCFAEAAEECQGKKSARAR